MFGETLIVEVATPRLKVTTFELRKELWLSVRVVLKPLVVIGDDVEAGVDVRA